MTPAVLAATKALVEALREDDARKLLERAEAAERTAEEYRLTLVHVRLDARARDQRAAEEYRQRTEAAHEAGRVSDATLERKLRGYESARRAQGSRPSADEQIVRELWQRRAEERRQP